MANKIIRYPLNETEDRILRMEAEKACRRPEQHARYLLRRALGLTNEQPVSEMQNAASGSVRQDLATNSVL